MLSQLIFIKLVELLVWSQFQAYLKKMNPQDKMYFDINYKPNITQETQNTKHKKYYYKKRYKPKKERG